MNPNQWADALEPVARAPSAKRRDYTSADNLIMKLLRERWAQSFTRDEIAEAIGCTRTKTYNALRRLIEKKQVRVIREPQARGGMLFFYEVAL